MEVLTDVMVMESGEQHRYNYGNIPPDVWQRDYVFVLKKHGIDTNVFKKTMKYYEKHPEEFSSVLEAIITQIQREEVKKNIPNP